MYTANTRIKQIVNCLPATAVHVEAKTGIIKARSYLADLEQWGIVRREEKIVKGKRSKRVWHYTGVPIDYKPMQGQLVIWHNDPADFQTFGGRKV